MRNLDVTEMEQKYSLEQVKKRAREKGLSVTGTKREIICRLVVAASILDELWESSAQPQKLPLTRKHKLSRKRLGSGISPQTTFERGMDYYKVPPEAY